MKKLFVVFVLFFTAFAFAAEDGRCYITENNQRMWEEEDIKVEYKIGLDFDQLMELHPNFTYDEIYFIVHFDEVIDENDL